MKIVLYQTDSYFFVLFVCQVSFASLAKYLENWLSKNDPDLFSFPVLPNIGARVQSSHPEALVYSALLTIFVSGLDHDTALGLGCLSWKEMPCVYAKTNQAIEDTLFPKIDLYEHIRLVSMWLETSLLSNVDAIWYKYYFVCRDPHWNDEGTVKEQNKVQISLWFEGRSLISRVCSVTRQNLASSIFS